MDNPQNINESVESWITTCIENTESIQRARYLFPSTAIDPPDTAFFCANYAATVQAFESVLAREPNSRILRFAALSPFVVIALNNGIFLDGRERIFGHLAALCAVDELQTLEECRFELYNQYLARNHELAESMWHRIALLELLEPADLYLERGRYWFTFVFGHRIYYELNEEYDYDFHWPSTLPSIDWASCTDEARRKSFIDRLSYAFPEQMSADSLGNWIITAWSCNPRFPKNIPSNYVDAWPTFLTRPDSSAEEGPREYVQSWHRDFTPITLPNLTDSERALLGRALHDLESGIELIDSHARAGRYLPMLARTQFSLRMFNAAANTFRRILEGGQLAFRSSDRQEDYFWEVWFSTAHCQRLAGQHEQSEETLETFVAFGKSESPGLPRPWGIHWWIAKWKSERGLYDEAARELLAEQKSALSPPDAWLLSTIYALSEVAKEQEKKNMVIRERFAKDPYLTPRPGRNNQLCLANVQCSGSTFSEGLAYCPRPNVGAKSDRRKR